MIGKTTVIVYEGGLTKRWKYSTWTRNDANERFGKNVEEGSFLTLKGIGKYVHGVKFFDKSNYDLELKELKISKRLVKDSVLEKLKKYSGLSHITIVEK